MPLVVKFPKPLFRAVSEETGDQPLGIMRITLDVGPRRVPMFMVVEVFGG